MRVRCETNTWQPGTIYAPDQNPEPVAYEGEVVGCLWDATWVADMFIIWDDAAQEFRKVPVSDCKKI